MKKRFCAFILCLAAICTLCACGDTNELDSYRKSVEAIDAESEKAPQQLLIELDQLNALFQDFAALEVPKEYKAVESLADEASALMNEAVSLYHSSYNEGSFDEFSSGMAYDKYNRAIVRINYIGDILQGKTPEGEDVHIYYEGEN